MFEIPTGPVCTDWYFTNPASNWHMDRTNLSGAFKTTPTIQFRSRIMVTAWLSTIGASLRGGNLLLHWIQQRPIKGLLGLLDALSPYFLPSWISLHSLSHPTQIVTQTHRNAHPNLKFLEGSSISQIEALFLRFELGFFQRKFKTFLIY